ncbi:MAG: DUF4058 family protein [Planctomycetia bacterium]|nr:DUF4058 family protein [Planctomycetia bacterium]
MPLLDHFHPPLSDERHWEGFHSKWANTLVDELNENLLPAGYFAEPHVHAGARVEIDAATFLGESAALGPRVGATATLPAFAAPTLVMPLTFGETFEVQVIGTEGGPRLVGAIELVSPANKDRPETRRAFALKCASYLVQGIGLIVVDIVTHRHFNLHDEIVQLLPDGKSSQFPGAPGLYAAAYRPLRRQADEQAEVWLHELRLNQPLPVVPLSLTADVCLPVDLEATYLEACRKLRLVRAG